jgi:excinuclease ABC subunit C
MAAMASLFRDDRFLDFGPSQFFVAGTSCPAVRIEASRSTSLKSQVRLLAPKKPGVYGMLDEQDQLIYVGKAKNLRTRLLSYFRRKGRPARAGKMLGQTRRILWEVLPSEFTSLLRELELIRRWRPRWNVQGQPLRRRLTFVCVGRPPAPYLFLSRKMTRTVQAAFGPVPAGTQAQEAIRRLSDWFGLRDCPGPVEILFPEQGELFPEVRAPGCLRMEIGTCLGPCTGTCARADYQQRVRQVLGFLAGNDTTSLEQLRQQMEAAAAEQQFERAAGLRDRWAVLTWLADRLQRVREAQHTMSFIYPVAGSDGSVWWYFIHGARTVGVVPAPTDEAELAAVRDKVRLIYRDRVGLVDCYEHADSMMLAMLWFRQHPAERRRCLPPERVCEPAHFFLAKPPGNG